MDFSEYMNYRDELMIYKSDFELEQEYLRNYLE